MRYQNSTIVPQETGNYEGRSNRDAGEELTQVIIFQFSIGILALFP